MHIADFELERYFARWEFSVEHLLCASDVEGYPMAELLGLADDEMRARWAGLRLGYTESAGDPLLRREIASLYETIDPDEVLVFAGAEEGIFCLMTVLLGTGDHAVVTWPGYQSLYEVARANGAEVTLHELREEDRWAIDLDVLRRQIRPSTKVIVVNVPHNPTGMLPDRATWDGLVALAEESGAHLFADEVYRFLESDPADRLPAGADVLPRGISLGVMSKSFALAGLRIGWVASHDRALLERAVRMKDYTTICSSAPSEVLATIALRARDRVIARSRAIVDANLVVLDRLFADRPDVLRWVRPRAGSVGFPRLLLDVPMDRFAADLVEAAGVLLLPGSRFGHPDNHFRIGFGRVDLPLAVARLEGYLDRVGAASGGATT
ncbi:MAG: aminotransferase class I/II-fold pyridoxal phosphate-dependent enzyme [Chloroflexi bacterium]|nr:aminotransferase class I/II-fold pyridoxal phosphate-dependent enzyme [Chloroflexota bacterium]